MALWYKHDIAAWMDGTEELDHEPYRVYHVICQLIYLNEAPIKINASGIAGRCKMSVRAFQKAFDFLVSEGFISVESGRISNSRATKEIEKMETNRENAGKGGKARSKSLENKDAPQASLQLVPALRLEKTRLEEKDGANAPMLISAPADESAEYYRAFKMVCGKNSGGYAKKLLDACSGVIPEARSILERAKGRGDAAEYIGGVISKRHDPQRALHGRF